MAVCQPQPQNPIRTSFDISWRGVPAAELLASSVACGTLSHQRHSLQLPTTTDSLVAPPDASELLQLLQQQGQQGAVTDGDIDAHIQRLVQLKQTLRHNKAAAQQHQQQQVILEDAALCAAPLASPLEGPASGLFASSAMATPLPSDRLLNGASELNANSWGDLAAARAASQPSRHSIDVGGLAQPFAALQLNGAGAGAAAGEGFNGLTPAQQLRHSVSFTAGTVGYDNRLSLDCGAQGLPNMTSDSLVAAAAMAAAQQQADASRRNSLCIPSAQMSGFLDLAAAASAAQQQQQADASRRNSLCIPSAQMSGFLDLAAAASAAQQQLDASRRKSLCMPTPQIPGMLDNMLALDSMSQASLALQAQLQAPAELAPAGAALAMQSALYAPAAPAAVAQVPMAAATAAGLVGVGTGMPAPAGRQSLDWALLAAQNSAGLDAMGGSCLHSPGPTHVPGLPSPMHGRASFTLEQPPLLADRGAALSHMQGQGQGQFVGQNDAAGWGFSARRAGGRASMDVHRVSCDLPRSHTPDLRQPPRKSVSQLTAGAGSSSGASTSSGSSGRSSPKSKVPQNTAANNRRTSMDRPPRAAPPTGAAANKAAPAEGSNSASGSAASSASPVPASRKGTGVFIPSCMIKS